MRFPRFAAAAFAAAAFASSMVAAGAQQFPDKPVRLIMPYAAGGSGDTLARLFAEDIGQRLGQPMIVENRTGAGGNIGFAFAAKSPPDGYTLASLSPAFVINGTLYKEPGYDPLKDFVAVAPLSVVPNVIIINADLPFKTLKELVDHARANPGKLNFASSGVGTSIHIGAEVFKHFAKVDILHVPYRGAAQAGQDLMGGTINMMFDSAPTAISNVRTGKARALAIASKQRHPELPDVPTTAEAGFPEVLSEAWTGLAAPVGTPPAVIEKIAAAAAQSLRDPRMVERLARIGGRPFIATTAEFAEFIKRDFEVNAAVIKATGIKAE
jgi:tripartite-type tricarboxylate transporter receptor subunit TctC